MVYCRDQLGQHLDTMQSDLESLKEFLRDGENYQVDANTILNVSINRIYWNGNYPDGKLILIIDDGMEMFHLKFYTTWRCRFN